MPSNIRHRRLYAFYNSKVINSLFIIVIVSLLQIGYLQSLLIPVICGSTAFAFIIGYTLWLWIKKPGRIIINTFISNISTLFLLYFLIFPAINGVAVWWYLVPLVAAIILYFIDMVRPHDQPFDI